MSSEIVKIPLEILGENGVERRFIELDRLKFERFVEHCTINELDVAEQLQGNILRRIREDVKLMQYYPFGPR